jgi:hypothetical protein
MRGAPFIGIYPRLVVFRKAFKMAEVFDRSEDGLNLSQKGLVDWLGEPICPFFDIFGIC